MTLTAILQHTPVWVWGLLAALIALGLSQARDREVAPSRVTILPVAMILLSASGVLSAFGPTPAAIAAWVAGVGAALMLGRRAVAARGARWSAQTSRLHVPGSWLPLALILALFCVKYGVGVGIAMNPGLARATDFDALVSFAYGAFSGLFVARALSLRQLVTRTRPQALTAA
jgi:hypothetical protein